MSRPVVVVVDVDGCLLSTQTRYRDAMPHCGELGYRVLGAPALPTPLERLPRPAAHRECPHCGGPVTIVALLTTPEAARPQLPPPHPTE